MMISIFEEKIRNLYEELNSSFKERDEAIAGSLLAIISGEHVLIIGPPGTAKSLLARDMCASVEGGVLFYYLLTRFTTPEEIFGPLSLNALENDIFKRKVDGYLPTASIAFLDEIFKANSSILNSLLTILNERKFHNGSEVMDVPLFTAFGASNELPEENESLEALYDRFLFRYYVTYIQDEENFRELISEDQDQFIPSVRLSLSDLEDTRKRAKDLMIDDDVISNLVVLRRELRSMGIFISDRRWKKFVWVLRCATAAIGRSSVDRTMIPLIQHMCWNRPEERERSRRLLIDMSVTGGVRLGALSKDIIDLDAAVKERKSFTFTVPVECRSCNREFCTWKDLSEHADQYHDHTYLIQGENQPYQLSSIKIAPVKLPSLLDALDARGTTVQLGLGNDERIIYQREVNDLKEKIRISKGGLETERKTMQELISTNIWLSNQDRSDMGSKADRMMLAVKDMEGMLANIEHSIVSYDIVKC